MNKELEKVLQELYKTKDRVRIFYGDPVTGLDWCETYDTQGYIYKSTGIKPCYILVHNTRSMGGSAILCDNIVKITKDKKTIYQTENYHLPKLILESEKGRVSVYKDGKGFYSYPTKEKAEKFVQFLQGERNTF